MVQLDFLGHKNAKESPEREGELLSAHNVQPIDYLKNLWRGYNCLKGEGLLPLRQVRRQVGYSDLPALL